MTNEKPLNGFLLAIKDWKVWWLSLILMSLAIGQSFTTYFPTLVATLGYNRTVSLLLCAPPWVFATVAAFFNARHSDMTGERFYHTAVPLAVGMIGLVIARSTMDVAARYISLFLMTQSYAGLIIIFTWCSNSLPRPPSKRAAALAMTYSLAQLGAIAGAYIWPSKWGPTYRESYMICIGCFASAIAMCFVFRMHLIALNRKLDNGEIVEGMQERRNAMQEAAELEGVSIDVVEERRKGFRFLY